jgi:hypothetical protein
MRYGLDGDDFGGNMSDRNILYIDWYGLYSERWKGEITREAFAHPAKFSRGLIRHIYRHMVSEGWLHVGDHVVDPFGGVALGGLDAMTHGLHWTGCELEERFVKLGNRNIDLWNRRYAGKMPHWGTARLVQGDSRELASLIGQASGAVSSPPFGSGDSASAQSLVERQDSSAEWIKGNTGWRTGYGSTPGNLGNMAATERGFEGAVSSPPYEGMPIEQTHMTSNKRGDPNNPNYRPSWKQKLEDGYADTTRPYGSTPGQLGVMGAVSSPPYEGISLSGGGGIANEMRDTYRDGQNYGDSNGQLGAKITDDFWSAARVIVEQTYQVLAPGAHAVWVVKAFVKNGKLVDFPGQWQALCEAVGFETVHVHRAWLVVDRGTQVDLEGNRHAKKVERKSFFRRLAESKGSPRIDYEVLLCMEKRG